MKKWIKIPAAALLVFASALLMQPAQAQSDWPSKPIKLIVAYSTGGAGDQLARILGDQLGRDLGVPIVVDNRAGASGMIGAAACKAADPDGHNFCVFLMDIITVNPVLFDIVPYDPGKDFVPVAMLAEINSLLVVPTSIGVHSIQDLIQKARSQPDTTNWGSWGVGSTAHLVHRMLEQTFDVQIGHVPYKNTSALINAVRTGEVDGTLSAYSLVPGHLDEGTMTAIAAIGKERLSFMPDVPTVSEQGVPFDTTLWYGLFAPAATPMPLVTRMNAALNQAIQKAVDNGRFDPKWFTPRLLPQAEFADFVQQENQVWGEIAVQSGITLN